MPRRFSSLPLPFACLAAAFAVAACSEEPAAPTALEPRFAGGPADGHPVVHVRQGGGPPAGSTAPLVDNLAEAVAKVRAGGVIRVHAGTYETFGVVIAKPLTIEAHQASKPPVIRTKEPEAFVIDGVATGTVLIRGLTFEVDGFSAVSARGSYDQARIEDCTFRMGPESTTGVFGGTSTIAGATVVVRGSSFSGGGVGVFAASAPRFDVSDSDFADHDFSGIQYQGGSGGRIERNMLSKCGPNGCIRVHEPNGIEVVGNDVRNEVGREVGFGIRAWAGGSITIADNEVTGSGDGDAFGTGIEVEGPTEAVVAGNRVAGAGRGIQFWGVPVGRIEDNVVDPCGSWNCIGVEAGGQDVLVTGNTVRSTLPRRTVFGIQSGWPDGSGSLVITDNEIEGVGAPSNPNDESTYPLTIAFQSGGWWPPGVEGVPLGEPVTFSGNRIKNAGTGVRAFHGGIIEGRDNTFTTVYGEVFGAHDRGVNRLQFNDVIGYVQALSISGSPVADEAHRGTLEVTCNYWGGGGPGTVGMAPAESYTPWATSPVAGTGATGCGGGV